LAEAEGYRRIYRLAWPYVEVGIGEEGFPRIGGVRGRRRRGLRRVRERRGVYRVYPIRLHNIYPIRFHILYHDDSYLPTTM
jgi:hypothetical protein